MNRFLFTHAGRIGDIIWSLWACIQRAGHMPFDFHLQTNVPDSHDPGHRKTFMSTEEAEFLASILREQPYIRTLTIGDKEPIPAADITRYVDLNRFRTTFDIYQHLECRHWYERLFSFKLKDYDKPIFTVPEANIEPFKKLTICFTERYKPQVSPALLEPYKEQLVYVGLKSEWLRFCSNYFHVDFHAVGSLKEMLQYTKKSLGFVSNICGSYAAHEAAAIPRIICLPKGGGDVRPYTPNGVGVLDDYKFKHYVAALLSGGSLAQ